MARRMRNLLNQTLHLVLWIIISAIVLVVFLNDPSMRCGMSCLGYGFGFVMIAGGINPFISLGLTGYLYTWVENRREKPKRKNEFNNREN
jgi:hypothetical protein